jgi:F-type H+-transporting ATPase subunit epsilon
MSPFRIEVLTPERPLYTADVDVAVVATAEGQISILAGHAPLVTVLGAGPLLVRGAEGARLFAIGGGVLRFERNRAVVLAEAAERADEIDVAQVEADRRRSESALASAGDQAQREEALRAMRWAEARLGVARAEKN